MSKYIDRDLILAGIETIKKLPWYNGCNGNYESLIRREAIDIVAELCIKQAPTADVAEVKHGEWKLFEDCANAGVYCTVCHKKVYREYYANVKPKSKYCPNCGAKMDGGANDEM